MRHICSLMVTLSTTALLHGCAHNPGQEVLPRSIGDARFVGQPGTRVSGYTTTDGAHHMFDGYAWAEDDSMVFQRSGQRGRIDASQREAGIRVAMTRLVSIDEFVSRQTRRRVLNTSAAIVVVGLVVAVVIALSSYHGLSN